VLTAAITSQTKVGNPSWTIKRRPGEQHQGDSADAVSGDLAAVSKPRAFDLARNRRADAITNHPKGFRFEVSVPASQAVTGVVLSDQLRTLSWPSGARKLSVVPQESHWCC
jgi:hypothetical protein